MNDRVSVETLVKRSMDRLGAVHSMLRVYTEELIRRAYKEGINVQISSGFRSNEDQAYIYGQGRPGYRYNGKLYGREGAIVSNARPGTSVHNYGLAIDYFLTTQDGSKSTWIVNAQWKRVGAIAKAMGFEWGGDWTSFKDYPHLQFTQGLSISKLRTGHRPIIPPLQLVAGVNEIKKEEVEYMQPTNATFRVGFENFLKQLRAEGVFSSNAHIENYKAGKLPVSDAIALAVIGSQRQMNRVQEAVDALAQQIELAKDK